MDEKNLTPETVDPQAVNPDLQPIDQSPERLS